MDNTTSKGLFRKVLWLLRHRPAHLLRALRGYSLFHWARLSRVLFSPDGVTLGDNVRLQKNSSLMAESPGAQILIESHSIVYEDAKIEAYDRGRITIGASSIVGAAQIISRYEIKIGERFLSSWNVFIQDYDSHPTSSAERRIQVENMVRNFRPAFTTVCLSTHLDWDFPGEPISIGDDVWVCAGASILKGAQIGSGSIVATNAVVLSGIYPSHSLIAGNPAKVIKTLSQGNNVTKVELDDPRHGSSIAI